MNTPIRLVLVDDHSIVRQGLRLILELEQGIEVVDEAGDSSAALQLADLLQPNIVLLDLSLDGHSPTGGLELCLAITARHPHIGVIVLTTFLDERLVLQAIRSGAKGYVLKDVDAVDLVKSIRAVSWGESALDTRSATLVMNNLSGKTNNHRAPEVTEREHDVIQLLARGYSNKAIGEQIAISTVKFHIRNIMHKMDVSRRTEIVYAASKLGLL